MTGLASRWGVSIAQVQRREIAGRILRRRNRNRTRTSQTETQHSYIATINIGTIKEKEIIQLMKDKNIKIIGLAETRLNGTGRKPLHENYELIYSGEQDSTRNGVALLCEPSFSSCIERINYINGRILAATLNISGQRTSFIQVYAPQQGRPIQEKLDFYEELERACDITPADSDKIIMGDLNGHLGTETVEDIVGSFGIGERNPEGELLIDFCRRNNMSIMNTYFKHQESHTYTWYRYNNQTGTYDQKSQIDFIISSKKSLLTDVKAIPSISLDADHRLLRGTLKIHTPPIIPNTKRTRIHREKTEEVKREIQSRFEEKLHHPTFETVEEGWAEMKETIDTIQKEVIGTSLVGAGKRKRTAW